MKEKSMTANGDKKTWRDMAATWLFQPGVSTVLLVVLVVLGIYTLKVIVPDHLALIQQGYERTEKAHEAQIKYIMDTLRDVHKAR